MNEESLLKVFPRYKEFPRRYTGCQISWIVVNDHWQEYAVAYFEKGKLVMFFGPAAMAGRKDDLLCRYRGTTLVAGPSDECPGSSEIVLKSMPAGCAQRIRSERTPPPECRDE
jgi:hypothetical protein